MIGAVILQIFLIFLNSIFSSAEIAIVSLTEADIHKLEEDATAGPKSWNGLPNSRLVFS